METVIANSSTAHSKFSGMASVFLVLWFCGCAGPAADTTGPEPPDTQADVETSDPTRPKIPALEQLRQEAAAQATEPAERPMDLAPPLGLETALSPLEGDALVEARKSLEQIIPDLIEPDYLSSRADGPRPPRPPQALKQYVLGRAAWRRGNHAEAIRYLQQAHRLDPKSPQVLRLLGWVHYDSGNQTQGALHLRRAVSLEPDAQSLLLLGRTSLARRRWSEALVILYKARQLEDQKLAPPLRHLIHYHLGRALNASGHPAAAVEQMQKLLKLGPIRRGATSLLRPLAREVVFLATRNELIWLETGDALCRLGELDKALKHYRQVVRSKRGFISPQVVARYVYANLMTGRPASAQLSVLSMLNAGTTGDEALRLVRYVFRHTDDDSRLTAAMRDVYERSGRPTPLVLAVYELMEGPARYDLLIEHLNLRPEDRMVFGRLAKDLVAEDPARLLGVTVRMMTLRPSEAARYARVLARHRVAADPLLALIEDQPDEYQAQAPALYLRGLAQRQSGRMGKARQAFEDSIKADPNFILPRLALVEMAMAAGRHDQAMALLKDVKESDQLLARRAEALLELSRLEEAGRDITLLLSRSPDKPAHHVLKARWLIKKGQTEEAVELLVSAQSRWPTHEPVYVELFELYERPPADREKVQKWAQLLAKARQHLPNSRVARVKAARAALNSRQFQLAEKLCDDLTHEFPSDGEIKAILAETYARTGRQDQGEKLLNDHIVQDPDDLQVVMAFRLINYDRFLEVFEAYWLRRPDTLEKWLSLYELYNIRHQREPDKGWDGKALVAIEKAVATDDPLLDYQHYALLGRQYGLLGKVEKGAAVFDKAIRKFPKHQVELLYQKSNLYSLRRDYAGAEKVLLKVLELEPKHPVANNDLGYFWAVQGRNLKRALTMTQTAVAAQPDSGAFLDSLGWVHYKLGNFTSAIRRLEEAVLRFEEEARQGAPSPGGVIADHLGDALWRNGQKQKAIGQWKIALAQARQRVEAGSVLDPDIKDLAQSLPKKIKRAEAGQHPLLAALPDQSLKALGKASETKINKQKTLLKKIGDPARDDWWRAQLEIVRQMDRLHDWHAVQQSPAAEALGQKTVRYIESLRKKHPQLGGETIRAAMESMLKKHRADTKQDDPSD